MHAATVAGHEMPWRFITEGKLLTWPLYLQELINKGWVETIMLKTHSTTHIIQYPRIMGSGNVDIESVFCDTQRLQTYVQDII